MERLPVVKCNTSTQTKTTSDFEYKPKDPHRITMLSKSVFFSCVLVVVGAEIQSWEAILALTAKHSPLPMQRLVLLCKTNPQNLKNLSITFLMTRNVTHITEKKLWMSGSGIVCSEDFGWNATLRLLQSTREFGFYYPWIVFHDQGVHLGKVNLSVAQRVLFLDMSRGSLQEVFTTGKQVIRQIGTLTATGLQLRGSNIKL